MWTPFGPVGAGRGSIAASSTPAPRSVRQARGDPIRSRAPGYDRGGTEPNGHRGPTSRWGGVTLDPTRISRRQGQAQPKDDRAVGRPARRRIARPLGNFLCWRRPGRSTPDRPEIMGREMYRYLLAHNRATISARLFVPVFFDGRRRAVHAAGSRRGRTSGGSRLSVLSSRVRRLSSTLPLPTSLPDLRTHVFSSHGSGQHPGYPASTTSNAFTPQARSQAFAERGPCWKRVSARRGSFVSTAVFGLRPSSAGAARSARSYPTVRGQSDVKRLFRSHSTRSTPVEQCRCRAAFPQAGSSLNEIRLSAIGPGSDKLSTHANCRARARDGARTWPHERLFLGC